MSSRTGALQRPHSIWGSEGRPWARKLSRAAFATPLFGFHKNASTCLSVRNPWLTCQGVLNRKHRNKAVCVLGGCSDCGLSSCSSSVYTPSCWGPFYRDLAPSLPSHLPVPLHQEHLLALKHCLLLSCGSWLNLSLLEFSEMCRSASIFISLAHPWQPHPATNYRWNNLGILSDSWWMTGNILDWVSLWFMIKATADNICEFISISMLTNKFTTVIGPIIFDLIDEDD